jgi:hypothetical protein
MTDAGADADVGSPRATCPEGILISARGNPVGLTSRHIRFCWPGEPRCFCDADQDCYAQPGYVSCAPPVAASNPIVVENARTGGDGWQLSRPAESREVEGYASTVSAVAGQLFHLYVNVSATHSVRWEAWRIGYYQGRGGRLVASGGLRVVTPQAACPAETLTGMVECAWNITFAITPDTSWVSGEYLIRLVRDDGFDSYVPMVIRESVPTAPLLFQASVNTWQAYNNWGGSSLYSNTLPPGGFAGDHAYRVSFDRPYPTEDYGSGQLKWWEMYMARWLEQRGYHVAYTTNVDVDADPAVLLRRRMVLTVGHDEYWSTGERDAFESARSAGVSLGFFSADTGVFNVRYAPSSRGVSRRSMVCYKADGQASDPERNTSRATTRFASLPTPRPENALMGVTYAQWSGGPRYPLVVGDPTHWIYAGTGVARGDALASIVGSEWDRVFDNGFTPRGLEIVATSPGVSIDGVRDVSHATVYYPTPTSIVFAGGTLSWALGLGRPDVADARVQRMTENILAHAGLAVAVPTVVVR